MAKPLSLPALLEMLRASLSSALESVPPVNSILPPKDANSLLDIKNDLILSYLQHLVFLIVLKIRNRTIESESYDDNDGDQFISDDAVVKKLVELRVYLDKGVRPLEGRLKYQIDKVLRAADDANKTSIPPQTISSKKPAAFRDDDESMDSSDEASEVEADAGVPLEESEIADLQYRPNAAALIRPDSTDMESTGHKSREGIYKPPKIAATSMPIITGPREKVDRRTQKSATLEEFVNTELSEAPIAEPSIGLTTVSGGRRTKSAREKKDEEERRDYEEGNYVRLPKETKKEKAKKIGRRDAGYGGEDWRDLDRTSSRIENLTQRKGGQGNFLEKSRKRVNEDGPKQNGDLEVGQSFNKRVKILNMGRRDRGRR